MVSDIVLLKELPEEIKNSVAAYIGCLAGAVSKKDYLGAIQEAGFQATKVIDEVAFPAELVANDPTIREIKIMKNLNMSREKARELARSVVSMKVSAVKPAA
jgi:hypothetical protein